MKIRALSLPLLLSLSAASPARADVSPTFYAQETAAAQAIQSAYLAHNGHAYRSALEHELARLPLWSRAHLTVAFRAYTDVVKVKGAAGLDSLLLSAAGALASRGEAGQSAAKQQLGILKGVYSTSEKSIPPQRLAAVARPGDPVIHHLPLGLLHDALMGALTSKQTDLDSALSDVSCDPAEIAAIAARYGQSVASRIQALCQTPSLPSGGDNLGLSSGISAFDCALDQKPSRGERMGELMRDCLDSLAGTGASSPLASGSGAVPSQIFPLRRTLYTDGAKDPDGSSWEKEFDANDVPVKTTDKDPQGRPVELTYFDDQGSICATSEIHYGADGEVDQVVLKDASGKTTWVVNYGTDADGNVTVDVIAYDENGDPIEESVGGTGGTQNTQDPGFDNGYGATPECRALSLAIVEDRIGDDLSRGHERPPSSVINPDPNAPVESAGSNSCDALSGGLLVDSSFGCWDKLASCNLGMVPDASCKCQPMAATVSLSSQCGLAMVCADGKAPTASANGTCACAGDEAFWDETYGFGGPTPPVVNPR